VTWPLKKEIIISKFLISKLEGRYYIAFNFEEIIRTNVNIEGSSNMASIHR